MISKGIFRADKIKYPDGIGCCVWMPIGDPEDEGYNEGSGLAFDFSYEDIDDFISILQELKEVEAEIYKKEEE